MGMVNGSTADRYGDNTFALGGFSLADGTNTFTAVGADNLGSPCGRRPGT